MKKITYSIALLVLMAPAVAWGAYDDVNLNTDAIIQVNGINLNVTGTPSVVQSITVNASDFSFVLQSGSSLSIKSTDRRAFVTDATNGSVAVSTACNSTESTISHTLSSSGPITVVVTPQTALCTGAAAPSSGGGSSRRSGGGGGGGAVTTAPRTTAPAASGAYTRNLSKGATGNDVKALQKFLNANGFTVAVTGPGSPGNETTTFGPATERALEAFQRKYDLLKFGKTKDPETGVVGEKTRAKLNELNPKAAIPVVTTPAVTTTTTTATTGRVTTTSFKSSLTRGATNSEVKLLQQLLNRDPATRVADSGVGSPGNETNFFGPATERALQKFQAKYNIISSGDPASTGYGRLGPKTKAMLVEVHGGQ